MNTHPNTARNSPTAMIMIALFTQSWFIMPSKQIRDSCVTKIITVGVVRGDDSVQRAVCVFLRYDSLITNRYEFWIISEIIHNRARRQEVSLHVTTNHRHSRSRFFTKSPIKLLLNTQYSPRRRSDARLWWGIESSAASRDNPVGISCEPATISNILRN